MSLFWKTDLQRAQKFLEQGKWPELQKLCRQVGFKNTQFSVLWVTAACALDDQAEIATILEEIRSADSTNVVLQNDKLVSRLVSMLETTNHVSQAGELLLIAEAKFTWTPKDVTIANRLARVLSDDHSRIAAQLLLAVGARLDWEGPQIIRAGRLAKKLEPEFPELSADLLLAIYRKTGWSEAQAADVEALLPRLPESPRIASLQTALAENQPRTEEQGPELTVSSFQFASYLPDDLAFIAPTHFTFEVYRESPHLVACEQRFRGFQKKFLPALSPGKPSPVCFARNTYFNRLGQIWEKDGPVIFNLGKKIDSPTPLSVMEVASGTAILRSLKGIYHWLAESLPSVSWIMQPGAEHLKIVVPADMPAFKRDSLRFAGITSDRLIPMTEEAAHFQDLYFTWPTNSNLFFSQDFFRQFIARAEAEATVPRADKIYISRKDSDRRVMENEAELERALQARGFYIAVLTKLPLADQIALFSRAKTIVAPHGGGLTHLIFARPGTQVVEIVPAFEQISDRSIHLRFNYARISMMKGLHYHLRLEDSHMTLGDWKSNVPTTLRLVDSLF